MEWDGLPRDVETAHTDRDPREIVSQLAARAIEHIYVDGGITIQGFLQAGLIQRLIITRGVSIVTHRRTLSTFVTQTIRTGLQIEALIEGELNASAAKEEHVDPARWYSVARARLIPTTFIIKARKPCAVARADR